jgi:hypothetical protein
VVPNATRVRLSTNVHRVMATATAASILSSGTAVVSKGALRGVPSGTAGKVIHIQGLAWTRYWVLFDNGVRMGTLDRSRLATPDEWDRHLLGPSAEETQALELANAASVAGAGAGAGSGAPGEASGVAESIGGVPGHLLERSRKARERWAAKAAG